MLPIQTILHPTDFSQHSEFAFRMSCALARDYNAKLIVLHAWSRPMLIYGEVEPLTDTEDYRREANQKLLELQAPDPAVTIEHVLVEGDAVASILQEVRDSNVDLVVMGMHGRTGLRRLLMGSTAEQVVRRASCPVVTVKEPFPHAESVDATEAVYRDQVPTLATA